MGLYFMLIAGAGADSTPAWDGALTFDVNNLLSEAWWHIGSALCSLLVEVLEQVFLFVEHFYFLLDGKALNMITVPLLAGACADNLSAFGGAFTFAMNDFPLWAFWYLGSAFF